MMGNSIKINVMAKEIITIKMEISNRKLKLLLDIRGNYSMI